MKAIQVNPETLDKIAQEIIRDSVGIVRKYHDQLGPCEEMYVVVPELKGNQGAPLKIYTDYAFFSEFVLMVTQGDWRMFPNDWFEVRDKR